MLRTACNAKSGVAYLCVYRFASSTDSTSTRNARAATLRSLGSPGAPAKFSEIEVRALAKSGRVQRRTDPGLLDRSDAILGGAPERAGHV